MNLKMNTAARLCCEMVQIDYIQLNLSLILALIMATVSTLVKISILLHQLKTSTGTLQYDWSSSH